MTILYYSRLQRSIKIGPSAKVYGAPFAAWFASLTMSSRCKPQASLRADRNRTRPFSSKKCFLLFFLLLLFPRSLYAWGDAGHRIVADVAARHLERRAHEQIRRLIGEASLASVADWADLIRGDRPETSHWHFVNIPFKAAHYDSKRDCAVPKSGDCVIAAIERFRRILSNRARSASERGEALKFLVHLVADLHQPLHAADRRDRGGNDLPVIFFGEKIRSGERPWNLHAVWDGGLIERTGLSDRLYAERLHVWLNKQSIFVLQSGTVVDWALEAHRAAVEVAYRIPEDRKLSKDYFEKSVPVMDELLAKAGVRLARVLNEAFRAGQDKGQGKKERR